MVALSRFSIAQFIPKYRICQNHWNGWDVSVGFVRSHLEIGTTHSLSPVSDSLLHHAFSLVSAQRLQSHFIRYLYIQFILKIAIWLILVLSDQQYFTWYPWFHALHTVFTSGGFLLNFWLRRWVWWVLFHPLMVSFSELNLSFCTANYFSTFIYIKTSTIFFFFLIFL